MILVADSGSTKTDWRLINFTETLAEVHTEGINPFHQRPEEIDRILRNSDLNQLISQTQEVYFYGAGCNYEDKIAMVRDAIRKLFPDANIFIEHDLLAAARSLCGRDPGIACILGTGSNSCFYDGKNIKANNPSLGYILGDEGSGVYMGKKLIQDYLYKKLPKSISDHFDAQFSLTIDEILDNVYSKYLPNRYLASFAEFVHDHVQHPYIHGIVYESFYDFMDNHISPYASHAEYQTHFVGSIAYNFQDILKRVTADAGLQIGKVIKSPIEGLTLYHQNKI